MLAGEFKKLLSLGIKIIALISRWETLLSGTERKYFDISLQNLTTTWHKSLGWDDIKLTSMSWKIIVWEIHHKSFIEDFFFPCGCVKGQMQSVLKYFGSITGTKKNTAASMLTQLFPVTGCRSLKWEHYHNISLRSDSFCVNVHCTNRGLKMLERADMSP